MSSDYSKLVEALRCCIPNPPEGCEGCTYNMGGVCYVNGMMTDAAAAIEALQKRLVNALTALHLANEKMGYCGIQPYTEADGEDMISDWVKTLVHEELKQQLPKRGEIVRCGECKYWSEVDTSDGFRYGQCDRPDSAIRGNCFIRESWFCADGERKVQE